MANAAGKRKSDNVRDMRTPDAYEQQLAQEYYGAAQSGGPLSLMFERIMQTLSNPSLSSEQYERAAAEVGRMMDQERSRIESSHQQQMDLARNLYDRGVISSSVYSDNIISAMQSKQEALEPLARAGRTFETRSAASLPQIAGMIARDIGLSRPQGIPGVTDKMIQNLRMSAPAMPNTASERARDYTRREQNYHRANVPTANIDQRTSGQIDFSVPGFNSDRNRLDVDMWSADGVRGFRAAAPTGKVDISEQAYQQFGDTDIPAGMRNFNPGNIKAGENWEGVIGESFNTDEGDPQAVFSDPLSGMRAAGVLAMNKQNIHGLDTVEKLIADPKNGWTPGNPSAADNIAKSMGIAKTDKVNLNDPQTLQSFLGGLITQEHGPKGSLFGKETVNRGAIQAVLAKAISPDFVRSALFSVPKGEAIPVSAALRGSATTQVAAAAPAMQVGTSTYDPRSAFMSAITPPSMPSIIDRVFPGSSMPAGGPRRGFQVPEFMRGAAAGVGRAAGAVRDAVFPGAADRRSWQDGTLDAIDVATPYDRNYGGKTSKDPKAATMDAVKAAVGSYFGPGYTVNAFSGTRPGSEKPGHRPDKTGFGSAIDFYVEGPKGRIADKETMHGFLGHLAELNPTASIGYDKNYMKSPTGNGVHFALDNRAEYWGEDATKHPDPKTGKPRVDPGFVQAIKEGRARAADKAANPQKYGGVPSPAPRGGLATGDELAEDRQKSYAPTMPGQMPTGVGRMPARTPYSPTMPTNMPSGVGHMPMAPLMMSAPAGFTGGGGAWKGAPMPPLPPASKRPGAAVPGVRPALPPAGMPAAKAAPSMTPNKVRSITFGPSGVPTVKGGSKQAIALDRAYSQYANSRSKAPAVAVARQAPAKESVGRQSYVSPGKEFDRLVTKADIPSLPSQPQTRGLTMNAPAVAPARESVGRKDYVSATKEFDRLVTSAGIPSLPASAYDPSRAKESVGRKNYEAPSPARSDMQRWESPPPAPTIAAREPARTADFRQSPAEARAQQMNQVHDQIVQAGPARQQTPLRGSVSLPADSVLNRQAPASIAGIRSSPAATVSAPRQPAQSNTPASFNEATRIGLSPRLGMQADKFIAEAVIAAAPALAAAAKTGALEMAKPAAPKGPVTANPVPQVQPAPAAPKPVAPPAPSAPAQNGSVVTTQTAGGGTRSVDTKTGWSSYTDPNTGVTTTFSPGGDYSVGGGQGMVGSGNGGGFGGK